MIRSLEISSAFSYISGSVSNALSNAKLGRRGPGYRAYAIESTKQVSCIHAHPGLARSNASTANANANAIITPASHIRPPYHLGTKCSAAPAVSSTAANNIAATTALSSSAQIHSTRHSRNPSAFCGCQLSSAGPSYPLPLRLNTVANPLCTSTWNGAKGTLSPSILIYPADPICLGVCRGSTR